MHAAASPPSESVAVPSLYVIAATITQHIRKVVPGSPEQHGEVKGAQTE